MLSTSKKKLTHKVTAISAAVLLTIITVSATGCSTTQEFKPTASIMVGASKSL
ncbi:hypothetical protein [Psychrobacter sp. M13]|uniref:hypothetical protein n=1 Tax=Psychrobacter sp. M13 TaxID=3067275 RepID=UPI0019195AD2|nr:hypothetical protein [Psychrobacter sp. M13]WLP95585.1 hypothetical protein Q9G97_05665 [Psychrobacter sp. M13]